MKGGKVKVNGSAPRSTPQAVKVGGLKSAPMAGDKMTRRSCRGGGAAIKGTKYMGC